MSPPKPPTFALKPDEAAALLGMSVDSIDRLRKDMSIGWIEGVHWFAVPYAGIRYNRELLIDWVANIKDPAAHQRAIENFQASLLSNKKRRRSA